MSSGASAKLLRLPEVQNLTGLQESSIYRGMSLKTFPAQVPIGGRSVAWVESEVKEWLSANPRRVAHAAAQRPVKSPMVPEGEPSAAMVRALIEKSGFTIEGAAAALDVSLRTLKRYASDGPRWRKPRPVFLAALNVLTKRRLAQLRADIRRIEG